MKHVIYRLSGNDLSAEGAGDDLGKGISKMESLEQLL